jgi:hypothetical protein
MLTEKLKGSVRPNRPTCTLIYVIYVQFCNPTITSLSLLNCPELWGQEYWQAFIQGMELDSVWQSTCPRVSPRLFLALALNWPGFKAEDFQLKFHYHLNGSTSYGCQFEYLFTEPGFPLLVSAVQGISWGGFKCSAWWNSFKWISTHHRITNYLADRLEM